MASIDPNISQDTTDSEDDVLIVDTSSESLDVDRIQLNHSFTPNGVHRRQEVDRSRHWLPAIATTVTADDRNEDTIDSQTITIDDDSDSEESMSQDVQLIYSPHPTPPSSPMLVSQVMAAGGDVMADAYSPPDEQPVISGPMSCGDCQQPMADPLNDKWIKCTAHCRQYYHISCVGISRKVYDLIHKTHTVKWMCYNCMESEPQDKPLFQIK